MEIKTKFKIGDIVYYKRKDEIVKSVITEILIVVKDQITTIMCSFPNGKYKPECFLYANKEDLLDKINKTKP